eukprot:TRINITY_DN3500_c0_g1_i3.p1 TRINITY_DN3500_c0_g1~~TRINITY_DN3500_c0_g1_i3.p1  ORF type:complete len:218 (-),score=14.23 TRINITY_DN3500_c0_g1_i3:140-748(-)
MIVKLKNRKLCLNILIQWSVCLALCFLSIIHHQQPFGFANAETQPSYASRPSYAGQIGLWTFQEGAGNATDTSGFGTAASLALLGTNPFTWNTAPVGITRTTAAGTGRATTASPVGKLTLQPNSTQQLAVELAFSLDSIAQDCTLLDVRSSSNGLLSLRSRLPWFFPLCYPGHQNTMFCVLCTSKRHQSAHHPISNMDTWIS